MQLLTIPLAFVLDLILRSVSKIFSALIIRLPVYAAYLALVILITVAYLASAKLLIDGINQTVPGIALEVWGWFMPDNAAFLITTWYTAKLLKWSYTKHLKIINQKTTILKK